MKNSKNKMEFVAGIDEVGRGCLAGPVVSAAVILDENYKIDGLNDSKKLTEKKRNKLAREIKAYSLAWAIAWSDVAEIDCLNILSATMLSMRRSILGLKILPLLVLVDGNTLPNLCFFGSRIQGKAIIGGDSKFSSISAASILAKVERDAFMVKCNILYPGYFFDKNKGYGTAEHIKNIDNIGLCNIHRKSFNIKKL